MSMSSEFWGWEKLIYLDYGHQLLDYFRIFTVEMPTLMERYMLIAELAEIFQMNHSPKSLSKQLSRQRPSV